MNAEQGTKLPSQGCKTSVWLATIPKDAQGPQGCYIADA